MGKVLFQPPACARDRERSINQSYGKMSKIVKPNDASQHSLFTLGEDVMRSPRNPLLLVASMLSVLLLPTISGCATFPKPDQSTQQSNLTQGTVKTKIIKGQTTQAEILQTFGAPNITTKNRNQQEVWNYHKISYESFGANKDDVYFFLQGGSRAITSTTSRSFDLIITFDANDVVTDYSVVSAQF